MQHTVQALQSELDNLRADNIKLYEKIKFLQSYPGRVSGSLSVCLSVLQLGSHGQTDPKHRPLPSVHKSNGQTACYSHAPCMKVGKWEIIGVKKSAVLCLEQQLLSPSAGKVNLNRAEGCLASLMLGAQISSLEKLPQTLLMLTASSVVLQQASCRCSCLTRQQAVK